MNNAVILNKDASTWPRIKKYFEERGVEINSGWMGDNTKDGGHDLCYYGIIDGRFDCYTIEEALAFNTEIIELPEENESKTQFWVWDYDLKNLIPEKLIEPEEPKEEKKYPEYPKPILRLAYEIIGRLKAENLKRAGFNDIEISTYLEADKDLKEIESHLNK